MSDDPEVPELPTPEEQAALALLNHTKHVTRQRVVSHMNGVGASLVNYYPDAEVKSWPIQKPEATAIIAAGEAAVLGLDLSGLTSIAPFLVDVCIAQHGPDATDQARAEQLWVKAGQVKANADTWGALSAFVNGLRARFEDRLEGAETPADVFLIESEIQAELGQFRTLHGV